MNGCRKNISMLSGLKMSSLSCKFVFYRPKYHGKRDITEFIFEALEMQILNTPTYRAHLGSYRYYWSNYHVYFNSYGH